MPSHMDPLKHSSKSEKKEQASPLLKLSHKNEKLLYMCSNIKTKKVENKMNNFDEHWAKILIKLL